MLERIDGRVRTIHPVSRRVVQLQLDDRTGLIELYTTDFWSVSRGDRVVLIGEQDKRTGKFVARRYRNETKGIEGHGYEVHAPGLILGGIFLAGGSFFAIGGLLTGDSLIGPFGAAFGLAGALVFFRFIRAMYLIRKSRRMMDAKGSRLEPSFTRSER